MSSFFLPSLLALSANDCCLAINSFCYFLDFANILLYALKRKSIEPGLTCLFDSLQLNVSGIEEVLYENSSETEHPE